MKEFLIKNNFLHFTILVFAVFTFWWIGVSPFQPEIMIVEKQIWSAFYWAFAVFGGGLGLSLSKRLGLWQSLVGRSVLMFSVGLIMQSLGQIIDSYISLTTGRVIYPSISEMGYVGSIVLYVYGTYLLARYAGISFSIKKALKTPVSFIVPVVMFGLSYVAYLHNYDVTNASLVQILFDFGYPILQSIYVSLALLVWIHSRHTGSGVLTKPIVLLTVGLVLQYVADSYFVYEFNRDRWYSGNFNDYFYLIAYFILTVAIIYLDQVIESLKNSGDTSKDLKESEVRLDTTYESLLKEILESQEEVIGPLAWTALGQVRNIVLKNKENFEVEILGDKKQAINDLLDKYFKVFGPTALYVAKRSTYRITKNMPKDLIPEKLI